MDSAKTIMDFVKPNKAIIIVFLCIPPFLTILGLLLLATTYLPAKKRVQKKLDELQAKGQLDQAAAELVSPASKRFVKGKVVMGEHFVFSKRTGFVLSYDEILWAYKHRQTTSFFFIPIKRNDSLVLATKATKPAFAATMGNDRKGEIKNALLEIYNHNNNCMIGATKENQANYKLMTK